MKLLFPPAETSEKAPAKPSPLETTFESWAIIKKTAQEQLSQEEFTNYIEPLRGTQPSLDNIVLFCPNLENVINCNVLYVISHENAISCNGFCLS